MSTETSLTHFPMGPKTKAFLAISDKDYQGTAKTPNEQAVETFIGAIKQQAATNAPANEEDLVDLMDELVAMNVPEAAMILATTCDQLWSGTHFRGELAKGIAAMLTGELSTAETSFRRAQELMPEEPAPYVNMAQICLASNEADSALEWALGGLEIEPQNLRVWQVYGDAAVTIYGEEAAADHIHELAKSLNAWPGASLAADLSARGDTNLKATYLKPFFDAGLREGSFLVEYTAALGMAGDFDMIPQILWDNEKRQGKAQVPWQLYIHAAQAHMAQNQTEQGLAVLDQAQDHPQLTATGQQAIASLRAEALEA